jgi:phasin
VKDANSKVEVNNPLPNTKVEANEKQANEKQGFDMSLFAMPGIFRGIAEQSAERARENGEKMKAASGEIADILRETYSTNAKGAADYGAKVIEISGVNTNSAFDFFTKLMETKSLSEIMKLSATQSRESIEVASAQNMELWELAQKAVAETAEPIKRSFTRVLQKAS